MSIVVVVASNNDVLPEMSKESYTKPRRVHIALHRPYRPPLVPCPWKLEPANEAAAAALRVFEPQIFTEEAASCHTCAQGSGRVRFVGPKRVRGYATGGCSDPREGQSS